MARGRRGNGEGSAPRKRKDGRWEIKVTLPGGERKTLYGKTLVEVTSKKTDLLHDLGHGLPPPPKEQTVATYLHHWLMTRKPELEYGSWLRDEQYVRLHITPFLGRTSLTALSPQQVQHLLAAKLAEGLSPTTVKHLRNCLHKAMQDAWMLGLVQRNVVALVRPPKMAKQEMRVLTDAEALSLLERVRGDRLEALYTMALYTGMREGELLGLRWSDVHLERGYAQLQTALKNVNNRRWLGRPKTSAGRRKVVLVGTVVEVLRAHRLRQREERLRAGALWQEHHLVFTTATGRPIAASNLRVAHQRLLKRLGLPPIRFHDLRHTTGTLLLLLGLDAKIVSAMLGHSSTTITQEVYQHVLPDMQRQAAEALEQLLNPATRKDGAGDAGKDRA